ncbi:hypothetical protein [Elioraea tepidiphila]|jgi:hypothetical protein|uniref:hypothetical protein n=1 Tax=Elioraea tepidiphila TaxID=457934 RepID=UPI00036FAEFD|nr:hypothetical protein [Elioraea tepidiphila]
MNDRAAPSGQAASAAEIRAILGPIDETLLIEIQRTGASAAEVLEAFTRLEEDDAVGKVVRRPATAAVVEVMAILDAARPGPERD